SRRRRGLWPADCVDHGRWKRPRRTDRQVQRRCLSSSFYSFAARDTPAGLREPLTEEYDQFVLRTEMELLPGVYFFNQTFHLTGHALARLPKLYYKCSSHNEFRIWLSLCPLVDISSGSR